MNFFAEELKSRLGTKHFGKEIICIDETDSTNALAKREIQNPDGTVFVSKKQTNGRGRSGNVWNSDDDNALYMSILLKPLISPDKVSKLTLVFGLAVFNALKNYADVGIKWPNDIILNNKKVSGIMCEMSADSKKIDYVICGVGVNVNNESFSKEIEDKATSLKIETGRNFEISEIASEILNEFELLYYDFLENGLDNIINDYRSNCITLSKEVRVIINSVETKAYALDITDDGELLVRTDNGEEIVNSGEASVRGINGYI